jgi:alpha-galactosidase
MVGYRIRQIRMLYLVGLTALLLAGSGVRGLAAQSPGEEHALRITVNPADGRYEIAMAESRSYALRAGVGVELDGRWLHASDYPRHVVERSQVQGYLGEATDWQVTYSGLGGQPTWCITCALTRTNLSEIFR